MDIKSTEYKTTKIKWIETIFSYISIDLLTFVFSLIVGILFGFIAMGFGSVVPIFIGLVVALLVAIFGALDGGSSSFIYVIKLGLFSVVVSNLLVLYPSTKFEYNKRPVIVDISDTMTKKGKKTAVTIYDQLTNEIMITKLYDVNKKPIIRKLYEHTKFAKYTIRYFPLLKYSRTLEFYDD
jgi:phosphoglycerol transferase MdoB-like AlkP superfamily enzyme